MSIARLRRPRAVFIDVGGPLYDDDNYLAAAMSAVNGLRAREGRPPAPAAEMRALYDAVRNGEEPSIRTALAREFLGDPARRGELHSATRPLWVHPPGTLAPDALPFLRGIAGSAVVGILANQEAGVVDALRRDGVGDYVSVWGVSALVGHEKPSAELFDWCLAEAGVGAEEAVHIGNRFDNDVRPAHDLGLGTVWVLRGEAPDDPSPSERAVADLVVPDLVGLDRVLFA
ncbi:HAD family hydrolase [Microbacterium flavum]|uniref:HAD family hydrolase n=1 Tax=Microbacterium flavum TaxID=415216 RepID=A0ABS5XQL4_9MICO|nr:HAD family hydrolase [Microbacterium flavum]MBT8796741.1 HAD family hydrolase [Microbacterium flavum]